MGGASSLITRASKLGNGGVPQLIIESISSTHLMGGMPLPTTQASQLGNDCTSKNVVYITELEDNVNSLKNELQKLVDTKADVKNISNPKSMKGTYVKMHYVTSMKKLHKVLCSYVSNLRWNRIHQNGKCLSLALNSTNGCHDSCKGNTANNDWIPSAANMVTFSSDKPKRSGN
ncbi:hypothetical protein Patl1_34947 [Pistacia atlantica]|uniref:Uncharacterized protein n=1 Tax=Pistacia atlantica TaxID=434234 RepID=A0ACC0ZT39_9ROSI|nr:hypothetical protein Patl1_34947 [Pistacia atlantica]